VNSSQLDLWPDEVAALPWGGRLLAQEVVRQRLEKFVRAATCGVDNSFVCCPSREAQRFEASPAQYQLCVSTSFR